MMIYDEDASYSRVYDMPYCSRCGNQVREGGQYCDRCGAPILTAGPGGYQHPTDPDQRSSVSYTWTPERKDPIIAVILALLIPGVGHIYVGKVIKGVLILLFMLLFGVFSWPHGLFLFNFTWSIPGVIWLSIVATIVLVAVYIWQLVDANHLAEKNNRLVPAQHRY